ncbi:hypothetical protein [Cohnella sp. GCM10027633]|uniref:hypothetical protein n=1 Tax=unclassified Cohnella TaxID=2636738 RepID=UPI00364249B6
MIPFRNSWPYDITGNDVFVHECPFCRASNVLLPLKPADVASLYDGARKILLVFPCCHSRVRIVDADSDYLLANKPLRADDLISD